MSLNSSFSQTDDSLLPLNPEAEGQRGPRQRAELSLSSASSSLTSVTSVHLLQQSLAQHQLRPQLGSSQQSPAYGSYQHYPGPGPSSPAFLPPQPPQPPQPQYNYYPQAQPPQQALPPHLTRVHYSTG